MVSKIDTAWNLFLEGKISEAKQLVEQDFSIDTCTDFSLLNLMAIYCWKKKTMPRVPISLRNTFY